MKQVSYRRRSLVNLIVWRPYFEMVDHPLLPHPAGIMFFGAERESNWRNLVDVMRVSTSGGHEFDVSRMGPT
jgi:hypothetical protein